VPADMGRRSPPRAASADNSFVRGGIQRPPRPLGGTVTMGEKRKREVDTQAKEGVRSVQRRLMGPFFCGADTSFRSTDSSFSQSQSQSQSQSGSQSEVGPSKPSRSYIPVRTWPSSSVDGTDVTPSLTSDGDPEQGPDEPLPPTPPQVPAIVVQEPVEVEEAPPPPPSPHDPEEVTPVPLPPTPPRGGHGISAPSVFDKRPPRSPLPEPSPRKARPPSRPAARPRPWLVIRSDDEDEDDPLASTMLDSPLVAVAASRSGKERRAGAAPMTAAAAGEPHRPARRRGSVSTAQSSRASSSSKGARRRTLDEELRKSDGVTEEDLRALEPDVYSAMASSDGGQRGFLAHGGGAGVPVLVGVQVEDFRHGAGRVTEDNASDSDEIEIVEPPLQAQMPQPLPQPRKRRGRAAAVGTRRR